MNIDDPERNENPEDDGLDLSLFEEAMNEIEGDEPKSEYGIIRKVLQELAEEYGFEVSIHDGRELGQPMSLNHRLDDFRYRVGGISDEVAIAMQANTFTREMADKILSEIMDEDRLFTDSNEDLQRKLEAAYSLIEVLIFLGESKYGNEDEFVAHQKDQMISDIRSYDLMLSTIHRYTTFLQEYIDRRPQLDNQNVNLQEALDEHIFNDKDDEDFEKRFKGFNAAKSQVVEEIRKALSVVNAQEVLTSELREVIRAYRKCIGIHFEDDGMEAKINQKELTNCVSLITRL